MGTVRKTITLTEKQDEWVKLQIAQGDYANESEYFRALIRHDQAQSARLAVLRQAIAEGLESGETDRTVHEIWAEVEAKHIEKSG